MYVMLHVIQACKIIFPLLTATNSLAPHPAYGLCHSKIRLWLSGFVPLGLSLDFASLVNNDIFQQTVEFPIKKEILFLAEQIRERFLKTRYS